MDSGKKSSADIIITLYQLSSLSSGCDIRPQQLVSQLGEAVKGAVVAPPSIPFKISAPAPKLGSVPLRVAIP